MTLPNGLDLTLINPSLGAKYSPNLFAWLRRLSVQAPAMLGLLRGWKGLDGEIFLAFALPSGQASANLALLSDILANGPSQRFGQMNKRARGAILLPDFWRDYTREGRCAFDRTHTRDFAAAGLAQRPGGLTCSWCGKKFDFANTPYGPASLRQP